MNGSRGVRHQRGGRRGGRGHGVRNLQPGPCCCTQSQVIGKEKVFKSLHRMRFFPQKSAGKFDFLRKLYHGGGDGRAKIRLGKICAAI